MPNTDIEEQDGLPPAGSRSGAGAQSVLPYLTKTLQGRPAAAPEQREREPATQTARPVFTSTPAAGAGTH